MSTEEQSQAPAEAPEHAPVSPEQEAVIDDQLGLVLLPPIRVDRATHTALMESAKATGKIIQAVVRDRLAPYAIPSSAVGDEQRYSGELK